MARKKTKPKPKARPRRGDDDEIDVKPGTRSDAYVGLLAISFLALLVGCVFMFLDHDELSQQKADVPTVSAAPEGLALPLNAPAPKA